MQKYNPEEYNESESPPGGFLRNLNPFAYVIIVLAIIFFLYQIIGGFIALAAGGGVDDVNVKVSRIVLFFSQLMFILAPTLFFTRIQTSEMKVALRIRMPKIHLLIFAILGLALIQPALQGYMVIQDYGLDHLPFLKESVKQIRELFDSIEKATLKIVSAYSVFEFIIVVLVVSVTPAICEEFLFRGFVLYNFRKIAKPSIAIFLTGFLFALYHFQPFNLVPLAMLGLYLGFVVYYSDSIITGIVCHFLNNFVASYMLYKYGKEDFATPHISGSEKIDAVILALTSLVMLATLMILFYRLRTNRFSEAGN